MVGKVNEVKSAADITAQMKTDISKIQKDVLTIPRYLEFDNGRVMREFQQVHTKLNRLTFGTSIIIGGLLLIGYQQFKDLSKK